MPPPTPLLRLLAVLIAVATVLAGGTLTLQIVDANDDGLPDGAKVVITQPPAAPPAVAVDGPDKDTKPDDALPLDPVAQAELERAVDATDKPGDTHREIAEPLREKADPSETAPGVLDGPLAAQEFPGCRTRFVRNYSSRNGTAVRVITWHQTVSFERGWSSQDALTARANTLASGVSWHFLIGRAGGRCTYSVPLNMKAWTQANANPFSIGIEVEAYGSEGRYVVGAGERKLIAVTREIGRRFDIPMRRARVVNCRPVTSGIIEHRQLGACGGGHVDVTLKGVDDVIAKLRPRPVTSTDRVTCRKLTWWRTHGRPHGAAERNAVRRRAALTRRGVTCTSRGPVRR